MSKLLLLTFISFMLVSCGEEPVDIGELLCDEANGQWDLSQVTCDGADQVIYPVSINFDHTEGTISYTRGEIDCQSIATFVAAYDSSALFSSTGSGFYSCTQTEASVNSCTGSAVNCDSAITVNGIQNDFDQCVISDGKNMTFSRQVATQLVTDNITFCGEGQREVLTFNPYSHISGAILTISESPTYSFGPVIPGNAAEHTFNVINTGDTDATTLIVSGLADPFHFAGGTYPGIGGTCASTIAISASCTLVIEFEPTTLSIFTDNIEISYNNGKRRVTTTRAVEGEGVTSGAGTALLTLSESNPYDYGTIAVGGVSSHTFTVTNSGAGSATAIGESGLSTPFRFSGGTYPGTGGDCGLALASSATCTILVELAPSTEASFSGTISLGYNDGVTTQTVSRDLQGIGAAPALLVISDGLTYDFAGVPVGNNSNHVFTIINTGGVTATSVGGIGLVAPFIYNGGAFPGASGTCGLSLPASASCTVDVQFSPGAVGAASDSIEINYSDGVSAQTTMRDIQGVGL